MLLVASPAPDAAFPAGMCYLIDWNALLGCSSAAFLCISCNHHVGVLQAASPGPPQPSADGGGSAADATGIKKKEKGSKKGSAKGGRPQFTVGRGAAMLQSLVEASMRQRLAAAAQPAAGAGVEPLSGMALHQQVKGGGGREIEVVIVADLQHQLFEERQS